MPILTISNISYLHLGWWALCVCSSTSAQHVTVPTEKLTAFTRTQCEDNVLSAPLSSAKVLIQLIFMHRFLGPRCDVDIDECASAPCQNSGGCIDGTDGFLCLCPAGFAGLRCETNVDECVSAPCLHGRYWASGHVWELKILAHHHYVHRDRLWHRWFKGVTLTPVIWLLQLWRRNLFLLLPVPSRMDGQQMRNKHRRELSAINKASDSAYLLIQPPRVAFSLTNSIDFPAR